MSKSSSGKDKKLAIVCGAPSSEMSAPFNDEQYEVWVLGNRSQNYPRFDRIFEVDYNENSEPNVSKMLANGEGVECRPYRSRTCDTLIKSQGVLVQARKEVKTVFSTP